MAAGHRTKDRSGSPGRRQRISMACQYCRHRKIRCGGGEPCRNCSRSQRECEYAPVPEEVNRATREKKAIAKAAKDTLDGMTTISSNSIDAISSSSSASTSDFVSPRMHHSHQHEQHPNPPHTHHQQHHEHEQEHHLQPHDDHGQHQSAALSPSAFPSFFEVQSFDGGYSGLDIPTTTTAAAATATAAASRPSYRRSSSVPGYNEVPRVASPTISQSLHSPLILEQAFTSSTSTNPFLFTSQSWMSFPSVLEPPHVSNSVSANPSTPPDSRAGSTEADLANAWASPNLHLRLPPMSIVAGSSSSQASAASASTPSPLSPVGYSPYPTPPLYTATAATRNMGYFPTPLQHSSMSPTLAPELSKDSIGLGIGMGLNTKDDFVHTSSFIPEEYMAHF